jgi:hypothetical protein
MRQRQRGKQLLRPFGPGQVRELADKVERIVVAEWPHVPRTHGRILQQITGPRCAARQMLPTEHAHLPLRAIDQGVASAVPGNVCSGRTLQAKDPSRPNAGSALVADFSERYLRRAAWRIMM